jgi:hypothetical protein
MLLSEDAFKNHRLSAIYYFTICINVIIISVIYCHIPSMHMFEFLTYRSY